MWRSDGQRCFDPQCGAYCKNSFFVICCPHECDAVGFLDFHPDQLLFKVTSKNKEKINSVVLIIPRIQLQTGAERLGGQLIITAADLWIHRRPCTPRFHQLQILCDLFLSVWSQFSCNFTVNRSLKTPKQNKYIQTVKTDVWFNSLLYDLCSIMTPSYAHLLQTGVSIEIVLDARCCCLSTITARED